MSNANTNSKLTDFKVLIFDVYGTLVDWETGLYTAIQPLLSRFPSSANWTRKEALLAYTSVEKELQVMHPEMLYSDLLARAHEVLEARLSAASGKENGATTTLEGDPATISLASASTSDSGPTTPNPHTAFSQSIKDWPLFPDTYQALRTLTQHYKLVVLSNVDHTSFSHTHPQLSEGATASSSTLYSYPHPNPHQYWFPQTTPASKSPFTLILTAQDTKCYKPAPGALSTALGCIQKDPALLDAPESDDAKDQVLMVAQSLYHDIVPSSRLGMKSVWIDRRGACMGLETPEGGARWTWRFETLGELAEAVQREVEVANRPQ